MPNLPPNDVIFSIVVIIFFAVGLHEFAHCKFADMAGDPTPGIYGRVTLNLTKHFEPFGTMMMLLSSMTGYGIGWGKPAPMDPAKMRNPRWDFFAAVLAGPISNVAQAVVYGLLAKLAISAGVTNTMDLRNALFFGEASLPAIFFAYAIRINMAMAIFNVLPIGPLDGHWLLGLIMPERPRLKWFLWNRHYGRSVLLILIILCQVARYNGYPQFDIIGNTVFPLANSASMFFLGVKLPPGTLA